MTPLRSNLVPVIDYERCRACDPCTAREHCRFRALVRFDREEPPYIDVGMCGGCGECMPHCPNEAIVPPERACSERT